MLLTPLPTDVTTHEQNILWSFTKLKTALAAATLSVTNPKQVIESQGYYASEIISIQEIASVDGGPRHILRILMPVKPEYYGSSNPVWKFAGVIVGGTIGLEGVNIPARSDGVKVRFNNAAIEKSTDGGSSWSVWGGLSINTLEAYIASDGRLYIKSVNGYSYVSTYGVYGLDDVTSGYPAIAAAPTSIRLHP